MTLDELKAFVTIADAGSFTKASALLHRSQPAISRRIDMLERTLGATLFKRHGHNPSMTAAGQALLPYAEAALAAVADGQRAVQEIAENTEARMTLAVVGTIADSYLVEVLRQFQTAHAPIRIDLQTANSREVSDLVRRGESVVGLRYFPDPDPRLDSLPLGSERLYVVVPADHPVKARRRQDMSAFVEDEWLSFPTSRAMPESYGSLLVRQLAAGGIADPRITTVDSLTAQKRLVEAGFGVALMPKRNVAEELARGTLRLVEIRSVEAQLPIVLVRRRGGPSSGSLDSFVAMLRHQVPTLLDS